MPLLKHHKSTSTGYLPFFFSVTFGARKRRHAFNGQRQKQAAGLLAPPHKLRKRLACLVERPDQSATGYIIRSLEVDGAAILERIAGRAEVKMQIFAADAHVLEQLVFQAAARHPAEQIWLGGEGITSVAKAF